MTVKVLQYTQLLDTANRVTDLLEKLPLQCLLGSLSELNRSTKRSPALDRSRIVLYSHDEHVGASIDERNRNCPDRLRRTPPHRSLSRALRCARPSPRTAA